MADSDDVKPESSATNEWFAQAYDELRRQARAIFSGERKTHTLQPTALVHEAFLRLAPSGDALRERGPEFLALTARAMRRALVDHARAKRTQKRGSGDAPAALEIEVPDAATAGPVDVLELEDALARLSAMDEHVGRVAELKLFAGMIDADVAAVVGGTRQKAQNDWAIARAWLKKELT